MAVECATSTRFERAVDTAADLRNDGASDGHVGDEVTIHDIDVEPVGALLHLLCAVMAEICEVGAEDRRGDDGGGSHFEVWEG